ncbi:putative molybdenum carrier protein, partial [Comamonas thiooxydans]|uniref:putative molybdenum carrier protein n=1 Tax=Comamonas thiooxydans TaxID=363952 RepID=UPI001C0F3007
MTTKELFTNGQALSLVAHQSFSYVPRTEENAKSADVTVAIAVDFNTAGERLTRRAAEPRYVAVPYGIDVATAAEILSSFMREHSARTLNVAGNGIY